MPGYPSYGAPPPGSEAGAGMPGYGQPAAPSMPGYGQGMPAPTMPAPMYGQPGSASVPLYGQPQWGAPGTPGAPTYGQGAPPSMPGGPTYGMPPTPGAPAYGQPQWGASMPPQQPKNRSGLIIGLVVGLVVLLVVVAGAGAALYLGSVQPAASATAVPNATTAPTATSTPVETVLFHDSLTPSNGDWANDQNCSSQKDGYHVNGGYICYSPAGILSDSNISVEVAQLSGPNDQPYGINFRGDRQGNGYSFDVDSSGEWVFGKTVSQKFTVIVDFTQDSAIHTGKNAKNLLQVRAKGSHFDFYVNGTQVGSADDTAFASGRCGLESVDSVNTIFTNFTVTKSN